MALIGIYNENDFYSNHYLTSVFENDIRGVMDNWQQQESKAREYEKQQKALGRKSETGYRAPYTQLASYGGQFFKHLNEHGRERNIDTRFRLQRQRWQSILEPLGYQLEPTTVELDSGLYLPVLARYDDKSGSQGTNNPFLWIVEAHDLHDEDNQDPLALPILAPQFPDKVIQDEALRKKHRIFFKSNRGDGITWQDIISKHLLTQPEPPCWILLLGNRQALLIDRTKWAQNRLLRFDFEEILGRKESNTIKATAALLHKDSVMPESGQPLLDNLDENSHKHAFSVSEDLKYALRESIELLGNEATQYLIKHGKANYTGKNAIQPEQLSLECLRYMYRMLFLFYIEARPELEYAPMKSMTYLKGYSLENLRDLEMVPLYSEEDKNGRYLHDSLNLLFKLIHKGYTSRKHLDTEVIDTFSITQLDSHLFDPGRTRLLNKVVFNNQTLQRIIQLMSLSRRKSGKRSRRGRISYAQLGINQLGAVYEALLSYRGFFAHNDLYEVKKAKDTYNELETGYFVTAEKFDQYNEDEKVTHTVYEGGEKKTRYKKFEKGSFIYRMAGRDREKSASYYTPEVLTHSLVKYALKELYKEKIDPLKTAAEKAEAIINLTVCEPAMGSAAFLNEAINQLSEQYLVYKQEAEDKRIPQGEYTQQLQRVKMYIADNNVFGVDLNPVAVELAEVSLWLNAISSETFVPWFGYQLFNGNSLIGARRQVFPAHQLTYKSQKDPSWLNQAPTRLMPGTEREEHQIYHFLFGDNGMADYKDKVVKGLKGEEIKAINDWRKSFNKPWESEQQTQLHRISKKIDDLWAEHTKQRAKERQATTDKLPIWPDKADSVSLSNMASKDQIVQKAMTDGSSSYQRLKMVMDYWCALWFWPVDKADDLPDREQYLFEIETLLDGYIQPEMLDVEPEIMSEQVEADNDIGQQNMFSDEQSDLFSDNSNTMILTVKGTLNKRVIFKHLPRLEIVDSLIQQYKYFHWELEFSDVFSISQGFDLVLGNPPWLTMEWNEKGILGDIEPNIIIKNHDAFSLNEKREQILDDKKHLLAYLNEYQSLKGHISFLTSKTLYHISSSSKADLYKSFIEKSFILMNCKGCVGLLHPVGIFEEERGNLLRKEIYNKLSSCFHFQNQLKLFEDIGNTRQFGIHIYSNKKIINFDYICNLFSPKTIDDCYKNSDNDIKGIKDESGDWCIDGYKSRLINIKPDTLESISNYLGISSRSIYPILPKIHLRQQMSFITKITKFKKVEHFNGMELLSEKEGQDLNILHKNVHFPELTEVIIYNSSSISELNPIYQTAKEDYKNHRSYDNVDLLSISEQYLPRSLYKYKKENLDDEALKVVFTNEQHSSHLRIGARKMIDCVGERTLKVALLPHDVQHTDGIFSFYCDDLFYLAGLLTSIPYDAIVKMSNKNNFRGTLLKKLPKPNCSELLKDMVKSRVKVLNCVTVSYIDAWTECSISSDFYEINWAINEERLPKRYWEKINSIWNKDSALKSDYMRRMALIELDVLSSFCLGLNLNELILLYRVQFPVMRQYEADTWYDQTGRITFTSSKGLVGVGLDRKYKKNCFKTAIKNGVFVTGSEAIHKDGTGSVYNPWTEDNLQLGWEDIKDMQSGIVIKTYMDDTQPGGPVERTIEYHAPFERCNREDDYNTVWKEFERRLSGNNN